MTKFLEDDCMNKMIEVCCGSYEDALVAYQNHADRIELNSALYLGGLTPSLGSLRLVKQNTGIKTIVMIRPRGAGFCYSDKDFEVMKEDTRLLMENGADGIAFGCLLENGTIDVEKCKCLIDIVNEYHGEVVFHRAFDCVKNPFEAIETLIGMGVNRILTSGQQQTAMDGKGLLKELQSKYGSQIEIVAGGGINSSNAKELMEYTGIHQIHSSCKEYFTDPTTVGESVSYAYLPEEHSMKYDMVDGRLVKKIVKVVKEL